MRTRPADDGNGNEPDDDEFFGFRPFPKRGGAVTNELIDQLRDELGE